MERHACNGTFRNGPDKAYVRCDRCGAIDYERNEGDLHPSPARTAREPGKRGIHRLRDKLAMPSFPNTRKALEEWDNDRSRRDQLWKDAQSKKDMIHWGRVELEAAKKVQEAFYQDTKEFNLRDRCSLVDPDSAFLRELVRKYGGGDEEDSNHRD